MPHTNSPLHILILGGYGTFGGRLARLLSDESKLVLLIAGRSTEKATEFCGALPSVARLVPLRFDRDGDWQTQLAGHRVDVVVDATGPFQHYGDDPYRVRMLA